MAYAQSYGMGPNAQYNYESMFRRGGYGGEGGGDRYSGTGPSNDNYNMGVQSPYSPPNNGGPGNPGTANNMPKPMLPRFNPGFQNNKGPAPLQGYNPNSPAQLDQRAIAADPQGFAQWQREAAAAGYNYGNSGQQGQQGVQSGPPASLLQSFNSLMGGGQQGGYNGSGINPQPYGFGQGGAPTMGTYSPSVQMNQSQAPLAQHLSGLSPVQTGGSAQFNRGYSGDTMQGRQDAWQNQQQAPRQDNYYRRPNMGGDPFNQYGYAGQSQQLGRYVPPMMGNVNDMNSWQGGGGYAYNIPNSYGSGQWNQFNSRDVAFPQFGQSPNVPTPRLNPGNPPPSYQSPFGRPDPQRQQNYLAYIMNLAQGGQAQSNYTQPGAPDQAGPVT